MDYTRAIEAALTDPKQLEEVYQQARRDGTAGDFAAEIGRRYAATPDHLLLAAWYYRLQPAGAEAATTPVAEPTLARPRPIQWRLAIPLSLALAFLYGLLTQKPFDLLPQSMPLLFLTWAPAAAGLVIAFLTLARSPITWRRPAGWIIGIGVVSIYVIAMIRSRMPRGPDQYSDLMLSHLPVLAWVAVAFVLLRWRDSARDYFAFLIKSVEVGLTGGIYGGAAGVFLGITTGLFAAIGIRFSDEVMRWLFPGVMGLIPVLAVASVYDPQLPPAGQRFDQGLARLITTLGRIFLPLTLIVLVIYVLSIPANFWKPFEQRDVLIVYNVMLFAVMGLIVIATPLQIDDVPEKYRDYLRRGILAVAALTLLVSLYALSATVYRTTLGGWTINRLTIIGWNGINISLLGIFLYRQWRSGRAAWLESSRATFRLGLIAYAIWTIFLILALPLLFW